MNTKYYIHNGQTIPITEGFEREDIAAYLEREAGIGDIFEEMFDDQFYTKDEVRVAVNDAEAYADELSAQMDTIADLCDQYMAHYRDHKTVKIADFLTMMYRIQREARQK